MIDDFVAQYEMASQKHAKDLSDLTQVEAVYEILKEHGPMRKEVLYVNLQQTGVKISTPSLSVVLSKDSRFISDGKGVWGLKE